MRLVPAVLLPLLVPLALHAQLPDAEYAARRAALLGRLDSGVVLLAGARDPIAHYPAFRQLPSFRYFTGYLEPDAMLVLVKARGAAGGTLFVPPTEPRMSLYTGRTTDLAQLGRATGLQARDVDALGATLDSLADTGLPFYVVSDAESDEFVASDSLSYLSMLTRGLRARHQWLDTRNLSLDVDLLRAKKSAAEVALLRKAAEISSAGHRAALDMIAAGRHEYEVQATMEYTFRRLGADRPAYASIVGSGPNSTTLHYDAGDRVLQAGEVVLMDVAAEYQGYAADITRTVPVNGKFTADQRAVYQLVLDVQKTEERVIKPGVPRQVPRDSAMAALQAGLVKLGLIDSVGALYDAAPGVFGRTPPGATSTPAPQWYLYSYHGYNHGLGLDVHDPAQFSHARPFAFAPGDVFTIEPGIYIRANALEGLPDTPRNRALIERVKRTVQRLANIGVRIEDDYVVTDTGLERISSAPREADEIEQAMRRRPGAK